MEIFSSENLTRLHQAHRRVLAETNTGIASEMARAGQEAVDYVKRYPRFTPRTGNLQSKTDWRTVRTSNGRILRIRNTAKYAAAIDKGARPHDIVATRKPYLHFKGKRGWVRTKRVKHPGNRPYQFLSGAALAVGRLMGIRIGLRMQQIARRF